MELWFIFMSCPSAPLEQNYSFTVGWFNGKHAKEDKSYFSNKSSEKIPYYRCDRKWATYMFCTAWWRHQMETFPFRVTGPFVRIIHRSPVNSPNKGLWHRALLSSVICAWKNGWVNNRDAGDLRRHRAHCDVIVMDNFDSNCHDQFQFEERETKLSHLHLDKNGRHFGRGHFEMHFLNENHRIPIRISLKFVPRSPVDNKPALVQVMGWRRTGDKPLPELILTQFPDAYMRH